jgi:hypothetical protein
VVNELTGSYRHFSVIFSKNGHNCISGRLETVHDTTQHIDMAKVRMAYIDAEF